MLANKWFTYLRYFSTIKNQPRFFIKQKKITIQTGYI